MMSATVTEQPALHPRPFASTAEVAANPPACAECLGSGGWFRYEPALEPSPGLLYLSCLHCRGSGRTMLPRA